MKFEISNKKIGKNQTPFVIAELSANHNGNIEVAKESIVAAKNSGADAVKLQTYTPDTMTINCNSDEFLIEKKNPLVMPPEYGDLPVPKDFEDKSANIDKDNFEEIIIKSKNKSSKKSIKKTNIEQSVLEKIN